MHECEHESSESSSFIELRSLFSPLFPASLSPGNYLLFYFIWNFRPIDNLVYPHSLSLSLISKLPWNRAMCLRVATEPAIAPIKPVHRA